MRSRSVVGGVLRRMPPALARSLVRMPDFGGAFAEFERSEGGPVELLSGYRNAVKHAWIHHWWPTRSLLVARSHVGPAAIAEAADELRSARTLERPLAEIARSVVALQRDMPEHLELTGRRDPGLDCPIVEPVLSDAELRRRAAGYRSLATEMRDTFHRHGIDVGGLRMLDVGCGTGYLAYAMAGIGAGEVVGADRDLEMSTVTRSHMRMIDLLAGDRADRVRIVAEDVQRLSFAAGEFDVAFSSTAVEHFSSLEASVAEMSRVLRRGGMIYHGVEPWFSWHGGHGLCTLDFPWGHVRVTHDDFVGYVDLFRANEARDAADEFTNAFQTPRLTLDRSRAVFAESFDILEWRELAMSALDPHRGLADDALLADCRRIHPEVTRRDLLTAGYTVVARARETA
jgi:SAM-dependent methyltransferase